MSLSRDIQLLDQCVNGNSFRQLGSLILEKFYVLDELQISKGVLNSFLTQLEKAYEQYPNPYHNKFHALDMANIVSYFYLRGGLSSYFTNLEMLTLTLAALAHDLGHKGLTNSFLLN